MDDVKAAMNEAVKQAMIGKDNLRRDVIRMAISAIKQVEIDTRKTLSSEEATAILQKEVKKRRESIDEARNAGRDDIAEQEAREVAILEAFLPEQLDREQIAVLVREAIAESGATNAKEMGKVMSALMPKVKGRADGKLVNEVVREQLNG